MNVSTSAKATTFATKDAFPTTGLVLILLLPGCNLPPAGQVPLGPLHPLLNGLAPDPLLGTSLPLNLLNGVTHPPLGLLTLPGLLVLLGLLVVSCLLEKHLYFLYTNWFNIHRYQHNRNALNFSYA